MSYPYQSRVSLWMLQCFGLEISNDRTERNHRFLEESLELVQSLGCTQGEALQLVDYVFNRPAGEPAQEVGGVMVTLAALCLAASMDMEVCGEVELNRIWGKIDQIRAKQAAKPKHSPLPKAPTPDLNTAQSLLHRMRDFRDGLPFGEARSALNDACDRMDVAVSKLASPNARPAAETASGGNGRTSFTVLIDGNHTILVGGGGGGAASGHAAAAPADAGLIKAAFYDGYTEREEELRRDAPAEHTATDAPNREYCGCSRPSHYKGEMPTCIHAVGVPDVAGLIERLRNRATEYTRNGRNDTALICNDAATALAALQSQAAHLEEVMVLRDAGISTASFGAWKRGDSIHSEYLTPGLKDVADLYEKYEQQATQIKELEAERIALKADAERYRWLHQLGDWDAFDAEFIAALNIYGGVKEDMDKAIDAARASNVELSGKRSASAGM